PPVHRPVHRSPPGCRRRHKPPIRPVAISGAIGTGRPGPTTSPITDRSLVTRRPWARPDLWEWEGAPAGAALAETPCGGAMASLAGVARCSSGSGVVAPAGGGPSCHALLPFGRLSEKLARRVAASSVGTCPRHTSGRGPTGPTTRGAAPATWAGANRRNR